MIQRLIVIIVFALFACGGEKKSGAKETPAAQEVVQQSEGEKLYKLYCIVCHGVDGKLALNGAKDITLSEMTLEERIVNIRDGKNLMTPFKGILTDDQIREVAEYTLTMK